MGDCLLIAIAVLFLVELIGLKLTIFELFKTRLDLLNARLSEIKLLMFLMSTIGTVEV